MKPRFLMIFMLIVIAMCTTACSAKIDIEEQLALGDRHLQEINYEQALVCYEKVILVEPKNMTAYIGAANAYMGQGKQEQAVAKLEAAMEIAETSYKEEQIILEDTVGVYLKAESIYMDSNNNVLLALDVLERGYQVYKIDELKVPKERYLKLMQDYIEKDDYKNAIAILERGFEPVEVVAKIINPYGGYHSEDILSIEINDKFTVEEAMEIGLLKSCHYDEGSFFLDIFPYTKVAISGVFPHEGGKYIGTVYCFPTTEKQQFYEFELWTRGCGAVGSFDKWVERTGAVE